MLKLFEVAGSVASVLSLAATIYLQFHSAQPAGRNVALALTVGFFIVTIVAFLIRRQRTQTHQMVPFRPQLDVDELKGEVELTSRSGYDHVVYYPKLYTAPPNLTFEFRGGFCKILIKSQRSDGFVFSVPSMTRASGEKIYVDWVAKGMFKRGDSPAAQNPANAHESSTAITDESLILTVSECAKILHLDDQGVIDLLRSGELGGLFVHGEWRVMPQQFVSYLSEKVKSTQLEILSKRLQDPMLWKKEIGKDPKLKKQIETQEYPEHSFGRFLQDALASDGADTKISGSLSTRIPQTVTVLGSEPGDAIPTRCFRCGMVALYGSKCSHCGAVSDDT